MEALDRLIKQYELAMSLGINSEYHGLINQFIHDLKAEKKLLEKQPFADIVTELQNTKPRDNY